MNLGSLPRVARTVCHIQLRQAWAYLRYALRGQAEPVRVDEPAPALRVHTAAAPFLPAPAHARIAAPARVRLINREVDFGELVDWSFADEGRLFAYHLHQCDYLRDPALDPSFRARIVMDWVERYASGPGWHPHPICLRTLTWGKLLLTEGTLAVSAAESALLRASMVCQVETLAAGLEVRLQANHLLSNLLGLVFAGLLFEGPRADAWLRHEAALRAELARQVHADGGHEERSPMYQALLLENLLDLLNLARAVGRRAPQVLVRELEATAARMLGALDVFTHPDGEIALFADSALHIAHAPAVVAEYARSLGVVARPPEQPGVLPDTGLRAPRGGAVLAARERRRARAAAPARPRALRRALV